MAGRTLPCRLPATVEAVVWHDDGYKATHGCNHSVQAAKITLSFTRETRMNE